MTKTYDYVGTVFDNDNTNPNKVTVALAIANKALEAGHSAALVLMVDAVKLSLPGKIDSIDIGEPFKPAKSLQEAFLEKGGEILVCDSCMVHNGIGREEIDPRFAVIDGGDVAHLVMNAKGMLQVS